MKLHEEFKLYEELWDEPADNREKATQPKPFNTKLRARTKGAIAMAHIVAAITPGGVVASVASGLISFLLGDIITDVVEAYKFNKTVKKHDKVKQLITKSYSLRRNIFKLIDQIGTTKTAEALEKLDNYVAQHPELLDANTELDINFDVAKNESLTENADNIDMSMEDFLKALADMRKEWGDDHLVDADEINAFVAGWKADPKSRVEETAGELTEGIGKNVNDFITVACLKLVNSIDIDRRRFDSFMQDLVKMSGWDTERYAERPYYFTGAIIADMMAADLSKLSNRDWHKKWMIDFFENGEITFDPADYPNIWLEGFKDWEERPIELSFVI